MIKFEINNLLEIGRDHGLDSKELESLDSNLNDYITKIHQRNQGFYLCPDDIELVEKINNFAVQARHRYKNIVVLGIGGSALGPIAIKEALSHSFLPQLPSLHIIDNIDPLLIKEIEDIIDLRDTLFVVITKSGGTPETLSQYFYFREKYENSGLNLLDHFVFITDPRKGFLREVANNEGFQTFEIPENIGGRFSVLTAVGLLPAALIGINISKILDGARNMRKHFLAENVEENICFQLAKIQFLLNQKGKNINVMMPYANKLDRIADWYRQLLAESIGKKHNNDGQEVFVGITPVKALGATDQHSQTQLYNEGPNDKLFIFLEVENFGPHLEIPSPQNPDLSYLQKTSFNELIALEKLGTEKAFTENQRPNLTIKIDQISPEVLGELFMLFEGSIAFLGEMFNINAYDQPGVELSKIITKKLLLEKHENS